MKKLIAKLLYKYIQEGEGMYVRYGGDKIILTSHVSAEATKRLDTRINNMVDVKIHEHMSKHGDERELLRKEMKQMIQEHIADKHTRKKKATKKADDK